MSNVKSVLKHRDKKRIELDKIKDKPCLDCGGKFPPYVMDFDHRPGEIKRQGLGSMWSYSMKSILEEIDKCDLICSNCHRIRTWNRGQHNSKK